MNTFRQKKHRSLKRTHGRRDRYVCRWNKPRLITYWWFFPPLLYCVFTCTNSEIYQYHTTRPITITSAVLVLQSSHLGLITNNNNNNNNNTRWRSSLRHCATTRKFAGSISDGVVGIFHWHNPSSRTMALGLTQPLTEMNTRNISWG